MKEDEKRLLGILHVAFNPNVREIVFQLGMNEKRAEYILEKWSDKGWYDYGVSVFAGWLTEEGEAASPY